MAPKAKVFLVVPVVLFIFTLIPSGMSELIPSNQTCTTQGNFEIVDGTCRNYYICIYNGVSLEAYNVTCSLGTLFNPITAICEANSTCTQTTPKPSPTTPSPTTPSTTTKTPCPGNGRFAIPGDITCQKYRICYTYDTIVIDRITSCPNSLRFNPTIQQCVRPTDYVCPTV